MLKHSSWQRDTIIAISEVDQRLRGCLQTLWHTLPREQVSLEELEGQIHRLVERALRDFREDLQHFPPERQR